MDNSLADQLVVMKLNKRLKDLLKTEDVTVAQLSRATGISSKTLYKWQEGQSPRDISQVKKVAEYFKITVDELCFGEEPKQKRSILEEKTDEILAGNWDVVLRRPKKT